MNLLSSKWKTLPFGNLEPTPQLLLALDIAQVAHTAIGQRRADKVTPYIVHPVRTAEILHEWASQALFSLREIDYPIALCVAFLHDVLEDTKLTRADLIDWGVRPDIVDHVDTLTFKGPRGSYEGPEYFLAIAQDPLATVVKAADRCSNLEDAIKDTLAGREPERWRKYMRKTIADVLPIYSSLPSLRNELESRISQLVLALDQICMTTSSS